MLRGQSASTYCIRSSTRGTSCATRPGGGACTTSARGGKFGSTIGVDQAKEAGVDLKVSPTEGPSLTLCHSPTLEHALEFVQDGKTMAVDHLSF